MHLRLAWLWLRVRPPCRRDRVRRRWGWRWCRPGQGSWRWRRPPRCAGGRWSGPPAPGCTPARCSRRCRCHAPAHNGVMRTVRRSNHIYRLKKCRFCSIFEIEWHKPNGNVSNLSFARRKNVRKGKTTFVYCFTFYVIRKKYRNPILI